MTYEGFQTLLIDHKWPIVVATLSRPPMNIIDERAHLEIERFLREADQDESVRVIVITGSGDRAFSAGGDIEWMASSLGPGRRPLWAEGLGSEKGLLQILLNLRKPLIARVNGHAMGVAALIAVLADFSFMVDNAKIADTHVKVGLAAGDGGSLIWPLLMGFAKARRYLLTGDAMSGTEAAAFGLITKAVTREALDDEVYDTAERLASGAGVAINYTKIAINLLLRSKVDPLIEAHYGLEAQSALSSDHREAVNAFLEGRRPIFTGS